MLSEVCGLLCFLLCSLLCFLLCLSFTSFCTSHMTAWLRFEPQLPKAAGGCHAWPHTHRLHW